MRVRCVYRLIPPLASEGQIGLDQQNVDTNGNDDSIQTEPFAKPKTVRSDIARALLRLANLDNGFLSDLAAMK
jgi:hypothetical protein